ncbi:hypothetical protein EIMP300_09780 [Escherichia coli]|uniref:Aromatic amino acid beta-eliminating lyase/threonine aldolase domain-containing protein n=1 Tax=Escherichia coli TaxID=562 RepID=A0A8S0FHL5_ECOLX|nr:hypothetical protein EIMP300_09780 [Escherichia coli]
MRYDFKGNFDLEGLERGIEEVGPNNVPYIVATITSNSAGGQPVSLANLKAMYSIAKKYDIPVVMDSARFAENAYFIKQREAEYKDWTIEQITRETYKYADMLAMSAKKDAMVPMGGLLCMKDNSFFDVYTECRTLCVVQEGFPTYGGLEGGAMERLAVGLYDGMNLLTGWLIVSRRCSIWSMVWKRLALSVSRRAVTRHSLMQVNCCRISRQISSRHRRWPASCIKSPVSVR